MVFSYGQETKNVKNNNAQLDQRTISRHSVYKPEQKKSTEVQPQKSSQKSVSNPAEKTNIIKPATKTNSRKIKTIISDLVNTNDSNLNNLLNLIEEKQKVNELGSEKLKSSNEYDLLLKNISTYKSKFITEVNSKGISNCSTREQNYFLSFLKEEGKKSEYQKYSTQLK